MNNKIVTVHSHTARFSNVIAHSLEFDFVEEMRSLLIIFSRNAQHSAHFCLNSNIRYAIRFYCDIIQFVKFLSRFIPATAFCREHQYCKRHTTARYWLLMIPGTGFPPGLNKTSYNFCISFFSWLFLLCA